MAKVRRKPGFEDLGETYVEKMDARSFKLSFQHHLKYTQVETQESATPLDRFLSAALAVRDRLVERMLGTQREYLHKDVKRVYYLSLEFLMGRYLVNNLLNLEYFETANEALKDLGVEWEEAQRYEEDAGLGNGGLGRLAACFLDSLATLGYPAYGYGIRYEYGIFRQEIVKGWQVEKPDEWLRWGNPWEVRRPENYQVVEFDGRVEHYTDAAGRPRARLVDTHKVIAEPYDTPVVGFGTNTVNILRLWSARSSEEFDFGIFNTGDYVKAVLDKTMTETISRVLYPNDATPQGRELRFRQQYFFVSATIKDIIRRYKKNHKTFGAFADKTAVQMNDTHPALGVSELMRLLVDEEGLHWNEAWELTHRCLGYTNHTLLPEALEKWPVELIGRIAPRNLEIIFEINHHFLSEVRSRFPGDAARVQRMSIIEEGAVKQIRMAHLAMVGSHSVNGVARLHTDLLMARVVPDFAQMWPERFNNKTNGVTQRRWMLLANPHLATLLNEKIGKRWITDLSQLEKLLPLADDPTFRQRFRQVKAGCKVRLAEIIKKLTGIEVDGTSIFDIQIKRIHEYKRQHLNALHILSLYLRLKRTPNQAIPARTFIFGGKAAPGYHQAKLIIKFITAVADLVNNDPEINGKLKVVFLPNYCVSLGQELFPAADVSEQISLAGMEASGTGNMKFGLNGAVTIGTLDGANIEILDAVGEKNIVIFGMNAEEVSRLRPQYDPSRFYETNPEIRSVIDFIKSGRLAPDEPGIFNQFADGLLHHDPFMALADFASYAEAHNRILDAYRHEERWIRMSIANTARMGIFSSDRTIRQYAEEIWGLKPLQINL